MKKKKINEKNGVVNENKKKIVLLKIHSHTLIFYNNLQNFDFLL